MLSNSAEYALRAVLFIAGVAPDRPVRAAEIAEGLGIPRNYLSKILHELTRAGVLASSRGRTGGFTLASPASEIALGVIVGRFDSVGERQGICLLAGSGCNDADPCAAHEQWTQVQNCYNTFFENTTVADLREKKEVISLK